jgi:hypothetical protein
MLLFAEIPSFPGKFILILSRLTMTKAELFALMSDLEERDEQDKRSLKASSPFPQIRKFETAKPSHFVL